MIRDAVVKRFQSGRPHRNDLRQLVSLFFEHTRKDKSQIWVTPAEILQYYRISSEWLQPLSHVLTSDCYRSKHARLTNHSLYYCLKKVDGRYLISKERQIIRLKKR